MKMAPNEAQPMHPYQLGDRLTLNEAATLLAKRDQRSGEILRQGIDRWRKRIKYGVTTNKLVRVEKRITIEDLAAWARQLKVSGADWSAKLTDLPRPTLLDVVEDAARASDETQGLRLPEHLEECHKEIRRLHQEMRSLKQRLVASEHEADQLREPAQKYRDNCEKNRRSALRRRSQR
ncbi:hypothetical protein SJR89_20405 [Aeromonas caviae]|uniref:hypothetical protein n=1 Tax=Aeromonas TaxID=642 RepID=UPI001118A867|nr:hypothetical protein [Aeromonas caviae]MDX7718099.1 hypothetical protein [Aeromonas caviae]MDX7829428.1 hypothetical protein [Aeromonas caviae]